MAKTKKKSSKKKSSKKKASKKKGLSKRKATSDELVWDEARDNCMCGHHSNGGPSPVMCGGTDAVSVFTDGDNYYVPPGNYDEGDACLRGGQC